MSTYKAYLKQAGEGCDHTIACAQLLIDVPGENSDEAIKNLKELILEQYTDYQKLESAMLLIVENAVTIDIDKLYTDAAEINAKDKAAISEQKELEEYERLQTKYGNNHQK